MKSLGGRVVLWEYNGHIISTGDAVIGDGDRYGVGRETNAWNLEVKRVRGSEDGGEYTCSLSAMPGRERPRLTHKVEVKGQGHMRTSICIKQAEFLSVKVCYPVIYIFIKLKLSGAQRRLTFAPLRWRSQAYPPLQPQPGNAILGSRNHTLAIGHCFPGEVS